MIKFLNTKSFKDLYMRKKLYINTLFKEEKMRKRIFKNNSDYLKQSFQRKILKKTEILKWRFPLEYVLKIIIIIIFFVIIDDKGRQ